MLNLGELMMWVRAWMDQQGITTYVAMFVVMSAAMTMFLRFFGRRD